MTNTRLVHDEYKTNTRRTHDKYRANTGRIQGEYTTNTRRIHDEYTTITRQTHDEYTRQIMCSVVRVVMILLHTVSSIMHFLPEVSSYDNDGTILNVLHGNYENL